MNSGIDILPTLFACAGVETPKKLSGCNLMPLALGKKVAEWRDHIVVENNMSQTGMVDGIKPRMEGRMVRTDRFKYCVYTHGVRRESLVDLQNDPGETNDLAADPKYRDILLRHRQLLSRFGTEHNDAMVSEILADDVKPNPFRADAARSVPMSSQD